MRRKHHEDDLNLMIMHDVKEEIMTYLEQYIGHEATKEDVEYFWKHTQENYDGFCPNGECDFDGSCRDCWDREVDSR